MLEYMEELCEELAPIEVHPALPIWKIERANRCRERDEQRVELELRRIELGYQP